MTIFRIEQLVDDVETPVVLRRCREFSEVVTDFSLPGGEPCSEAVANKHDDDIRSTIGITSWCTSSSSDGVFQKDFV